MLLNDVYSIYIHADYKFMYIIKFINYIKIKLLNNRLT